MPEGHTVHRLARTFREVFAGQRVRLSSPQGRFAADAACLDGWWLTDVEAAGKHLLLHLAPVPDAPEGSDSALMIHVHLGLYGSWTFAGDPDVGGQGSALAHAIGAPRVRVGEREQAVTDTSAPGDWRQTPPRGQVRLRILGERALADLTGPTACEVIDAAGRTALLQRLGPDPLRGDAESRVFVERVRRSRTPIGQLLMDQAVVAGIGNIYRAELLFRARVDPWVPGRDLTAGLVEGLWEDLVPLIRYGERTGRIVTTQVEHRHLEARLMERPGGARQNGDDDPAAVPREQAFYVYHRQTLPCRLCHTPVRSSAMAGRTVYWCPRCQRVRTRRSPWSREHPADAWALE
ncbi:Fpg/Nei family DNA glycosylase [Brachybacterium sp. EF45031]|uniref:Fpg/Nei family DNA glycosylase n=1 Tax=Brachybacterium sillae TaxID=2810536 RepID=UPI00217E413C|nr:DNA-formamidopyrimidine glycosylase family protein [Brachybacterium sillae]MCS6712513.1 Fpg/Nei family DNA glycosylase [Brachybacterium sillae]